MNCINCNQETNNPKFCSRSCSASYSNKFSPKRKRIIKFCIICNGETNNQNDLYCSHKCYSTARWQTKVNQIESTGIIHNKGIYHSSKSAKKYISELNGPNCSVCNQEPLWNDKELIMILDHINGIPDDWRPENLRLVCPNCDTQLSTYKSKNKFGGRPSRRVSSR